MNTIKLTDIIIHPNRQRKVFDPTHLQELKNSIELTTTSKNNQLQHAPVLRREGDELILVSGETRLKVLEEIFALGGSFVYDGVIFTAEDGHIPYVDLGELSPLEAEEAELDENLRRRDLTWQEHAAAVSKLNALRVKQSAQAIEEGIEQLGIVGGDYVERAKAIETLTFAKAHTVADTAEELTGHRRGSYADTVRKEIIVAKHLENPDIAKAKNVDEAFKILRKQEEAKKNLELAKVVGASFDYSKHKIYNDGCVPWMEDYAKQVAAGEAQGFDVILTDPPYGMDAQDFGDGAGKMTGIEHHYDDSYESWKALMNAWTALSYQITAPQAHAYLFCDIDNFHELKAMMQAAGWYVFRTPFIMHKLNSGRVPMPDRGPRRQYETILYAIKGNKPVTHIYSDVIPVQGDDNMTHGAQKSVAVYQNLLQRSVRPGDTVIDTFAGSGTIFPAAHLFKCAATGIEVNPEYYGMCLKRLKQIQAEESTGFDA